MSRRSPCSSHACGGSNSNNNNGGAAPIDEPADSGLNDAATSVLEGGASLALALDPATLRIGTDQHAKIHATLTRASGFKDAVTLEGSATGLNPLGADIAAGETDADIAVWATSAADVATDGVIRAIVGGKEIARATFHLVVVGVNAGLDATFGTAGTTGTFHTSSIVPGLEPGVIAKGLAVGSDGAVLVAGSATGNDGEPSQLFVARLTSAGVLDTAGFANNKGIALVTASASIGASALVLDSSARPVVSANDLGAGHGAVFRFTSAGALDTTLNATGRVDVAATANLDAVVALADNSIVVGGGAGSNTRSFVVAKLSSAGVLDGSFGESGVTTLAIPSASAAINRLALDSSERIVAGGPATTGYALARFTAAGAVDTTFGDNGVRMITGATIQTGFVILPDAKIIVVASQYKSAVASPDTFAFSRFTPDGAMDASFGAAGQVIASTEVVLADLVLTNNGQLYISGQTEDGYFGLTRFGVDGAVDRMFGVNGALATGTPSTGGAARVALTPDGKVVTTGDVRDELMVMRYTP